MQAKWSSLLLLALTAAFVDSSSGQQAFNSAGSQNRGLPPIVQARDFRFSSGSNDSLQQAAYQQPVYQQPAPQNDILGNLGSFIGGEQPKQQPAPKVKKKKYHKKPKIVCLQER